MKTPKEGKMSNVLEYHLNRRLWNKAVDLIDKPFPVRRKLCTVRGEGPFDRGCSQVHRLTTSSVLLHIRTAMLCHDWSLVRQLLSECYLKFHRRRRSIVHQIMFQILFSSPASSEQLIKDFCRMFLGIGSDSQIQMFLRVISAIPEEIPRESTKLGSNGKIFVVDKTGCNRPADAYIQAAIKQYA